MLLTYTRMHIRNIVNKEMNQDIYTISCMHIIFASNAVYFCYQSLHYKLWERVETFALYCVFRFYIYAKLDVKN